MSSKTSSAKNNFSPTGHHRVSSHQRVRSHFQLFRLVPGFWQASI